MIQTNIENLDVHIDPLTFAATIRVLSGNTIQVGDGSHDGYMPSREFIPCVLMPEVSVSDPEGFQNGLQELASCKWYIGIPLADDSNVISSTTPDFEVVMDEPYKYALKIKKNVPPFSPIVIHALFSFLDIRTGVMIDIERQVTLSTVPFDASMLHLQLDDTPSILPIDPLSESTCGEEPWLHDVSVQLFSGRNKVADSDATYQWRIVDSSTHAVRDFTEDEKTFIYSNVNTRSLTFDARFIESATLICTASTALSDTHVVDDSLLEARVNVSVDLPETINAKVVQTSGFRVSPRMETQVSFQCDFYYNKGVIENKPNLFRVVWFAKDATEENKVIELGEGISTTFIPRDLGFTRDSQIMVYTKVYQWSCVALMVDESNNAIVNANNNYILINTYK